MMQKVWFLSNHKTQKKINPQGVNNKDGNAIFTLAEGGLQKLNSLTYDPTKKVIPVFDNGQTLLEIEGGAVEQDDLGRWILTVHQTEKKLKLKFQFNINNALNKQRNKIINDQNYKDVLKQDGEITPDAKKQITDYFSKTKSNDDRANKSCAKRVEEFIKDHNGFTYGSNGSDHAYLVINNKSYAIDLDGATAEKILEKEEEKRRGKRSNGSRRSSCISGSRRKKNSYLILLL